MPSSYPKLTLEPVRLQTSLSGIPEMWYEGRPTAEVRAGLRARHHGAIDMKRFLPTLLCGLGLLAATIPIRGDDFGSLLEKAGRKALRGVVERPAGNNPATGRPAPTESAT